MPPDGSNGQTKLYKPFQSIGARGLNNLANKLLIALLPPNAPFFRLVIDDFTLMKLTQREGMRAETEKTLNKIERSVQTEIESTLIRVKAVESFKQLLVAGNVLCHLPPDGGMRAFHLDRYVLLRDPSGNLLEFVTKEAVSPIALPEEIRQAVVERMKLVQTSQSNEKTVDLYTHVERKHDKWTIYQEVKGIKVPGSQGWYPLDKLPWMALRWTSVEGESYGRGYIEELIGDLRSLEGLMKAIVEGAAAAAKVLFLVNPNGTTSIKAITDAPSGGVRSGNAQDVTTLQLDKYADFRVALETIKGLEQRLGMAFMLKSTIQRNGDRVTAEEIREVAGELDDGLGGFYSSMSQEFQLPLVKIKMAQMEKAKKLPPLPKDIIRPSITTGLEALGRGHDLNKLDALLQGIAQTFGPEALAEHVNIGDYIMRRGTALGMDMDGLVKSPEQIAEAQQARQQQMMMERLGPNAMNILRDQMDPGKQPQ